MFDTNILIDVLNGIQEARRTLKSHPDRSISIVTWIEVMVGTTPENKSDVLLFLRRFELIQLTPEIAEETAIVRQKVRLKLPDSIILATAQVTGRTLLTRNTKDFVNQGLQVSIPYVI